MPTIHHDECRNSKAFQQGRHNSTDYMPCSSFSTTTAQKRGFEETADTGSVLFYEYPIAAA
jgi:hypothetical protein